MALNNNHNLEKPIESVILVFGELGRWHSIYAVADQLQAADC